MATTLMTGLDRSPPRHDRRHLPPGPGRRRLPTCSGRSAPRSPSGSRAFEQARPLPRSARQPGVAVARRGGPRRRTDRISPCAQPRRRSAPWAAPSSSRSGGEARGHGRAHLRGRRLGARRVHARGDRAARRPSPSQIAVVVTNSRIYSRMKERDAPRGARIDDGRRPGSRGQESARGHQGAAQLLEEVGASTPDDPTAREFVSGSIHRRGQPARPRTWSGASTPSRPHAGNRSRAFPLST